KSGISVEIDRIQLKPTIFEKDPELHQEVLRLLKSGLSVERAAIAVGKPRETIRSALKRHEGITKGGTRPEKRKQRAFTEEEMAYIHEHHATKTVREIADHLRLPIDSVRRRIRTSG